MSEQSCFYCDSPIVGNPEMDHFPIPKRSGGTETVPSCKSCHDLKDRLCFGDTFWAGILLREWPRMTRETRLLIAKATSLASDATSIITRSIPR
jgi:hypothetical protein